MTSGSELFGGRYVEVLTASPHQVKPRRSAASPLITSRAMSVLLGPVGDRREAVGTWPAWGTTAGSSRSRRRAPQPDDVGVHSHRIAARHGAQALVDVRVAEIDGVVVPGDAVVERRSDDFRGVAGAGQRVEGAAGDGQVRRAPLSDTVRRALAPARGRAGQPGPSLVIVGVGQRALLEVRQDEGLERAEDRGPVPRRQDGIAKSCVVVHRQPDLLQVVDALGAAGGLASAWTAGKRRPIRTAMIAMTTSNSISVNPRR